MTPRLRVIAAFVAVCGICFSAAPARAQVNRAGFVPRANLPDPRMAYLAYSWRDDADALTLRFDLWTRNNVGLALGGDYLIAPGSNGGAADGLLMFTLHRAENCLELSCLGVQFESGASVQRLHDLTTVEIPITAGIIQRASIPTIAVAHAYLSGGALIDRFASTTHVGSQFSLGIRLGFHGSLAPWGVQIGGGLRNMRSVTDGFFELGINRSLKTVVRAPNG